MQKIISRELIVNKLHEYKFHNFFFPDNFERLKQLVYPLLINPLNYRIAYILNKMYVTNRVLARKALLAESSIYIDNSFRRYFFSKKFKDGVPVLPYMIKSLSFFYSNELMKVNRKAKSRRAICVCCREYGHRSYMLELSNNMLYCSNCDDFINNYDNNKENDYYKNKLYLSKIFVNHSKSGAICSFCKKFIPYSYIDNIPRINGKYKCPYISCGKENDVLDKMAHPVGISNDIIYECDINNKQSKNIEYVECKEEFLSKFDKLKNIIITQKKINSKESGLPNKRVMYDTLLDMLDKYPVEVMNYLVMRDSDNGLPLQSIIFQNFCKKMIDLLPYKYIHNNNEIIIDNSCDIRYNLFTGVKNFIGIVDENLVIKKPTVMARFKKDCGIDCLNCPFPSTCSFIGYIKSAIDINGSNLIDNIDNYCFTSIKFNNVKPISKVFVEYYAIPAHYSMKSMAHLQRIVKRVQKSCGKIIC